MRKPFSSALGVSHGVLRLLIMINWLYGVAILVGLLLSFTAQVSFMAALGVPLTAETEPLVQGMRAMAMLGLVTVPLHYVILKRLLEIVESVRMQDPFIAPNAIRLQAIAWAMLGLQVLSLVIGAIAGIVSTPAHPLHVDAGFSTGGWLAVLLLFVLARVFAQGAWMRDELQGTV